MGVYRKNVGLLKATYKSNVKVGSIIIESPGKFLANSYGLDAASLINVKLGELPNAITDFIGGNASVTAMTIPPSVSDVNGIYTYLFPNLEKVYLGNAEGDTTLKDGLDRAYANLTVDVYCEDGLVAGYQTKYASATNLTFIGVSNLIAYEIPFVGETTLTADYVEQCASDLGTLASAMEKIIVPSGFTDCEIGVGDVIYEVFPNCEEISLGNGQQTLQSLSWSQIRMAANMGIAKDVFSLGDEKTDVGSDSATRVYRLVSFNAYGKTLVFEQKTAEGPYWWNYWGGPTDDDGCYNDYAIAPVRTTGLPSLLSKYSSSLRDVIENTTYGVAKNGKSSEVLHLTDKLFLPAEGEYRENGTLSTQEELAVVEILGYYQTHSADAYRIKADANGTATKYWLRSPIKGKEVNVVFVGTTGQFTGPNPTTDIGYQLYVTPLFTIGSYVSD